MFDPFTDSENYNWSETDPLKIRAACEARGMAGADLDTAVNSYIEGKRTADTSRVARVMAVVK